MPLQSPPLRKWNRLWSVPNKILVIWYSPRDIRGGAPRQAPGAALCWGWGGQGRRWTWCWTSSERAALCRAPHLRVPPHARVQLEKLLHSGAWTTSSTLFRRILPHLSLNKWLVGRWTLPTDSRPNKNGSGTCHYSDINADLRTPVSLVSFLSR